MRSNVLTTPQHATQQKPSFDSLLTDLHWEFNDTRKALLERRKESQHALNQGMLPNFIPQKLRHHKEHRPAPFRRYRSQLVLESSKLAQFDKAASSQADSIKLVFENHQACEARTHREIADLLAHYRGEQAILFSPRGLSKTSQKSYRAEPGSASLYDIASYMYAASEQSRDVHLVVSKLENHLEARFIAEVVAFCEGKLGLEVGSSRVSLVVDHILASFELESIILEFGGRLSSIDSDSYAFAYSVLKCFQKQHSLTLAVADKALKEQGFMQNYQKHILHLAHKYPVAAMSDAALHLQLSGFNQGQQQLAQEQCRMDASQGFDGCQCHERLLLPTVNAAFERRDYTRQAPAPVRKRDLLPEFDSAFEVSFIQEDDIRQRVASCLSYLDELQHQRFELRPEHFHYYRAQLWTWMRKALMLENGTQISDGLYRRIRDEEILKRSSATIEQSAEILDRLLISERFKEDVSFAN